MENRSFDFGRNWKAFSDRALNAGAVAQAREDFIELLSGIDLSDRTFLDIGFGQGLTLLLATSMGAQTVGCDINPLCAEVLRTNQARHFPELSGRAIPIIAGSILDETVVESLRGQISNGAGKGYDVVHSWGVLHHTGEMKRAIRASASLVVPGGHLIIAIYARHWSSPAWKAIKYLYNHSPEIIQRSFVMIFYPIIGIAKWLVTKGNPLHKTRGMDFYYDVVDWIGGYPYEYASAGEVIQLLQPLGFQLKRCIAAAVPTGCNQFVFQRGQTGPAL